MLKICKNSNGMIGSDQNQLFQQRNLIELMSHLARFTSTKRDFHSSFVYN